MAGDAQRDLLPVKENWRNGKGFFDKFDYQILGKLSRCELEDRFLRLLDEQTHIKKLANSQEEKIKRLGTKLLRLLNDRKVGKKVLGHIKTSEDLELRIIELEHENYALKDKNTVLKQQLSSHSRHPLNHRSPLRSNHTSPLMTTRHPVQQSNSEIGYETTQKTSNEMQLQEAESHISELNEEIKSLHDKIDFLQRNLEKNSLDNRKVKVTENIELIRLQRSLKQQAIQIASLQAQIKCSENSQKVLKEELIKAHKENDDALHLISVKQTEILNLCSKLDEKNLNKLEEDELKGRIDDLLHERDCLKERSEYLLKNIGSKASDSQRINDLQKLLTEEKHKKEKLEETLEVVQKNSLKICAEKKTIQCETTKSVEHRDKERDRDRDRERERERERERDRDRDRERDRDKEKDRERDRGQGPCVEFSKVGTVFITTEDGDCICNKCNFSFKLCKCTREKVVNPELETESEISESDKDTSKYVSSSGEAEVQKVKLKRELQHLRGMLKNQTARCEAQQAEISRLVSELKVNEAKCNETLKRLDFHLKVFQCLDMHDPKKASALIETQTAQQTVTALKTSDLNIDPSGQETEIIKTTLHSIETQETVTIPAKSDTDQISPFRPNAFQDGRQLISQKFVDAKTQTLPPDRKAEATQTETKAEPDRAKMTSSKDLKRKDSVSEETLSIVQKKNVTVEGEKSARFTDAEQKKRFVDQKFLDSSDDEMKGEDSFKGDSFLSKVKNLEDEPKQKQVKVDEESEESDNQYRPSSRKPKGLKSNPVSNTSIKPQEIKKDISRRCSAKGDGRPQEEAEGEDAN